MTISEINEKYERIKKKLKYCEERKENLSEFVLSAQYDSGKITKKLYVETFIFDFKLGGHYLPFDKQYTLSGTEMYVIATSIGNHYDLEIEKYKKEIEELNLLLKGN